MDSIIEHNHVLQFAEPLGAFMQMEVDHSSSSSLESPNHGTINYCFRRLDVWPSRHQRADMLNITDIDMDSSSSSRPGYQEDGDIALDDGTGELYTLCPFACRSQQRCPDRRTRFWFLSE